MDVGKYDRRINYYQRQSVGRDRYHTVPIRLSEISEDFDSTATKKYHVDLMQLGKT